MMTNVSFLGELSLYNY